MVKKKKKRFGRKSRFYRFIVGKKKKLDTLIILILISIFVATLVFSISKYGVCLLCKVGKKDNFVTKEE